MSDKSTVEQDKQRSEILRKQLVQLNEDFYFMKKSKEEWYQQLDARFQDLYRYIKIQYRKIEGSKQYIASEAKRTSDTLLAFQHKFYFYIDKTRKYLRNGIDTLSTSTKERFDQKNTEITQIAHSLEYETKFRSNQFEEGMKYHRNKFEKTNEVLEKEKYQRIKNYKDNMGKINESLYLIKEQLSEYRDKRNLKIKELEKYTTHELESQQYHEKSLSDFKVNLNNLKKEMDNRFNSKDELVNSIAKIVKTLQATLREPN